MAPVGLLDVRGGQKILDLCAAPGGKSTQIAALMEGKGLLVSNEIHPARARILSENIERMGICNACVTNETPQHLSEIFVEYFDRILVDAPCSGEGMFRKNEAACEEWSPENVELCGDRQDEILDCAAAMLAPGGRLVYSTCTFAPKENEGSVSRFLSRHPEFVLVPIDKCARGFGDEELCAALHGVASFVEQPADGIEGTLRLWPHRVRGEGHYAAVLEKRRQDGEEMEDDEEQTGSGRGTEKWAVGGLESGSTYEELIRQKDLADFVTFCEETLRMERILDTESEGVQFAGNKIFLRFGDQLYLAPDCLPALKGMKVLRPGLHIGTLKKNRFEPSHALALALTAADVRHSYELTCPKKEQSKSLSAEKAAAPYLGGQTFPAEGEKGWYLICVEGFSLGWGKLAGGVMKNHYPKGLRK